VNRFLSAIFRSRRCCRRCCWGWCRAHSWLAEYRRKATRINLLILESLTLPCPWSTPLGQILRLWSDWNIWIARDCEFSRKLQLRLLSTPSNRTNKDDNKLFWAHYGQLRALHHRLPRLCQLISPLFTYSTVTLLAQPDRNVESTMGSTQHTTANSTVLYSPLYW